MAKYIPASEAMPVETVAPPTKKKKKKRAKTAAGADADSE
jgi:hypothetical protein